MSGWRQAVSQNWATPTSVLLHGVVIVAFLVQFSKQAAPLQAMPETPSLAVEVMLMPPPPPPPAPVPEVVDEPPPMIETVAKEAPAAPPPPPPEIKKKPDAPKPVVQKKPPPVPVEPSPQPPEPSLLDTSSFKIQDPLATQAAIAAPVGRAGPPPSYSALISAALESHKVYPRLAQARRQQGRVSLQFVIDRRGNVLSHKIVGSSGYQLLDNEVEALIQRVSPLPPMPPEMTDDTKEFTVAIDFYQH
jgi:protein TonB